MKILGGIKKSLSIVATITIFAQMLFLGVTPTMAAAGPVLDSFAVTPTYNGGTMTNQTPILTAHASDTGADITSCQYRWETNTGGVPNAMSAWLPGTFTPDVAGVLTAGTCSSPAINIPTNIINAGYFSGDIMVTDSLAATATSVWSNYYNASALSVISDIVMNTTVTPVLTNNSLPLPTIQGTINDPSAIVIVYIWSDNVATIQYSTFDAVNNGDGTWSGQIPAADVPVVSSLADGTYSLVVETQNSNPDPLLSDVFTYSTWTVNTIQPVIAQQADITVSATSAAGANVTYTAPIATDAFGNTASANCSPVSGSLLPVGTTTVTCNYTDLAGNMAVPTTFNVIVSSPVSSGPILDSFTISPSDGVSTSANPVIWVHVTDSAADLTGCEYQYQTDLDPLSGWLPGFYTPDFDVNSQPIIGSGSCQSDFIATTPGATWFSGEIRVTDTLGATVDSGMSSQLNINTVVPVVTVNQVITDNNPVVPITGTIDDPNAAITLEIHQGSQDPDTLTYPVDYFGSGTNNGDGTWTSNPATDFYDIDGNPVDLGTLPVGDYQLDVWAYGLNSSTTSGTYTVIPVFSDTTAPVITVLGNNPETVIYGDSYVDAGTTVLDNVDGDLTPQISVSGTVDTLAIGSYTLTYSVTDEAGNTGTATRTVNVVQRPITVTADSKTKVFGSLDPAFTFQITSGELVDDDVLTGTLSRVAGESVGTYQINIGTLANPNYNISFVSSALTITPAPVVTPAPTPPSTTVAIPSFVSSFSSVSSVDPANTPGAAADVQSTTPSTSNENLIADSSDQAVKASTDDTGKDTDPVWKFLNFRILSIATWFWLLMIVVILGALWYLNLGRKQNK